MLEKNSYRKTSRISLVFVPLNGILIKITHRKTPIAYIFASKYFTIIHLHPSGKKKSRTYLIWYPLIS